MALFSKKEKKKRPAKLYFALVVADRDANGFQFVPDKDCTAFLVSGEIEKHDVIPRSVLREVVDRFNKLQQTPETVISERAE